MTSGACSTWWEVIFWCKSGRIRSKPHDSQSINRQIRHGNCRLWLLPAHETPLSTLKLFILSQEKRKKKLRGRAFSFSLVQRSYALGSNAHKALMSTLWHASGNRLHRENTVYFQSYYYWSHLGGSWDRETISDSSWEQWEAKVYSSQLTRWDYSSCSAWRAKTQNHILFKVYIRFIKG